MIKLLLLLLLLLLLITSHGLGARCQFPKFLLSRHLYLYTINVIPSLFIPSDNNDSNNNNNDNDNDDDNNDDNNNNNNNNNSKQNCKSASIKYNLTLK